MDYYSHFLNALDDTELEDYRTAFEKVIQEKWHPECHGDFARWEKALAALPQESCSYDIKADTITVKDPDEFSSLAQRAFSNRRCLY